MEITGRVIADAKINALTDGREVVAFTLVINDQFKTKAGEKREVATFFNCSYWLTSKVAQHLKKGSIVSVYGRIGLNVYKNQDGEAKGSLTFHVNDIKFVAKPAHHAPVNTATENTKAPAPEVVDDLPF
jgi:single-strand DNA-binding protein